MSKVTCAQVPVAGSHVAVWHASTAAQTMFVPSHLPLTQVSVWVHKSLSLHGAEFGAR
ncbi:MAG: hypothetical protein ACAI38_21905 [Myxococcota bacterium]